MPSSITISREQIEAILAAATYQDQAQCAPAAARRGEGVLQEAPSDGRGE